MEERNENNMTPKTTEVKKDNKIMSTLKAVGFMGLGSVLTIALAAILGGKDGSKGD